MCSINYKLVHMYIKFYFLREVIPVDRKNPNHVQHLIQMFKTL